MEKGFATLPDIVNKLEESQIEGQMLLRNAAMGAQPGTQQRPKPFQRVDMHFMKAVPIVITSIFSLAVINAVMVIAPRLQSVIDGVFIGIKRTAFLNHAANNWLDGLLLHIL